MLFFLSSMNLSHLRSTHLHGLPDQWMTGCEIYAGDEGNEKIIQSASSLFVLLSCSSSYVFKTWSYCEVVPFAPCRSNPQSADWQPFYKSFLCNFCIESTEYSVNLSRYHRSLSSTLWIMSSRLLHLRVVSGHTWPTITDDPSTRIFQILLATRPRVEWL